jgi:hypothetical protein
MVMLDTHKTHSFLHQNPFRRKIIWMKTMRNDLPFAFENSPKTCDRIPKQTETLNVFEITDVLPHVGSYLTPFA